MIRSLLPAGFLLCAVPVRAAVIPGEVLVRFRAEAPAAAARGALDDLGGREDGGVAKLRIRRVRLPPGLAVADAVTRLARRPEVEFAEPNHRIYPCALPCDPYLDQQWALDRIELERAWRENVAGAKGASGATVKVAVLDSGICTLHPDLQGRVAPSTDWYNALSPGSSIEDDDTDAHGTFVAGEIAAATDNAAAGGGCEGVAGVVWNGDGSLVPVKVVDSTGHSGDAVSLANGIIWAADHGARVINMSLSTCDDTGVCPDVGNYTELGAVEYAHAAGAVIVAAAGNASSTSPSWPAAYPYVVGVSATDRRDALAAYSNRGSYIDLAAPGGSTLALDSTEMIAGLGEAACILGSSRMYGLLAGTSMAAPMVSGLAALLMAQHPDFTNDEIVSLMERTADQPWSGGWNPSFGYGRINAYRALTGASSPPPPAPSAAGAAYAYPNPFSPLSDRYTTFVARPAAGEGVRIRIYDPRGTLIWEAALTPAQAAAADLYHASPLRWGGTDQAGRALANGVYLARIDLGARTLTKRVAVLR